MIANLLVVVFILAMGYWWALQGFFSGFLHLMLVIICGALAFAFWEPLVFAVGMNLQPAYAWGLWLIGPFLVMLFVTRFVVDRVVKKNVQFQDVFNKVFGGITGLLSGTLTAGIVIIGLGFLPLPSSLAGYEPLIVSPSGEAIASESGDLWVPVDRIAGGFFGMAAYNGFYHPTPLPEYQPQIARAASLYRLRYDPYSSAVAVVGSVNAPRAAAAPTPIEQLDAKSALALAEASGQQSQQAGRQLVVIDTDWRQVAGTYDTDRGLRIPPTQIRLITRASTSRDDDAVRLHPPIAFSKDVGDSRELTAIRGLEAAFGNRQSETFAWAFVIPEGEKPLFLRVRNLRLTLPTFTHDPAVVSQMIGAPVAAPAGEQGAAGESPDAATPSELGGREGMLAGNVGKDILLTSNLPRDISSTGAHGLSHQDGAITEGTATASKPPAAVSRRTRLDRVYIPPHQGGVRLQISADRAKSLWGQSRTAAASLQGVWLVDARGDKYMPIGYSWYKGGSGEQQIRVTPQEPITSARQLPIQQMGPTDELYLYFAIPKGAKIVSYNIGDTTRQAVEPPLSVN